MAKVRNPVIVGTVVALLAGTTGFCSYNPPQEPAPMYPEPVSPPVRLLPEAVVPYPLEDAE